MYSEYFIDMNYVQHKYKIVSFADEQNNYLCFVRLGYPSHQPQQRRAGVISYGEVVKHQTYY